MLTGCFGKLTVKTQPGKFLST